jgi:outer membrane lipoprotein-sorting protein
MMRILRLALALGALFWLASPAVGQSLSLRQVQDKMEAARAGVEDLSAKAVFGFQLQVGILPYNDTLHGSYYFKKPDRHRLDFPDAPSYLRKVPSMFSWQFPNPDKYDARVTGPIETGQGPPTYQLLFASRNPASKTTSITMIVDALKWRVTRQDTLYKDGGSVLLRFSYLESQGLPMLEKVAGQLDIPSYSLKGTASISLSEHQPNRGLSDSVFTTEP